MPSIDDMMTGVRDALTVKRVFGDPYEKDGVTIIPAAAVRGGGGGGEGQDAEGQSGGGGGFGITARPVGAYQIKGGEVTWIPAADVTRVLVASLTALVVVMFLLRPRRRRRR